MLRNNAGLVILLAVVIGFIWPTPGDYINLWLDELLMLLIYLSCLDLEVGKIWEGVRSYKKLIGALMVVHLLSPMIVFLLRGFFSPEIYLGMILVTAVPSGRSSVFLSSIFGGEPEKALVITTLSNIISPIVMPVLVWMLAGRVVSFDTVDMGLNMARMVVIPIMAAVITNKMPWIYRLKRTSTEISTAVVFVIVLGIVSPIRIQILNDWRLSAGLFLLALTLMTVNFIAGWIIGKTGKEKVTFAISSSYKNYSLATIVALGMFGPMVALPSLIYAVGNNLLLLPMQLTILKRK